MTTPADTPPLVLPDDLNSKISHALASAVAQCWSTLPQEVQQNLFEAAVTAHGESLRSHLALFLHGKHTRTTESLQARAMPEPDSLGGG